MHTSFHSNRLGKVVSVLLLSILLFSCWSSLAAVLKEYKIEELKLTIPFPDDWLVVTRDSPPEEDFLSNLQMESQDEFAEYLESNKIYLVASNRGDMSIVLISNESDDFIDANFNLLDDTSILELAESSF